ncbi:MAG: LacI family DNA-binding transcriptional regulator [Halothermotrichaceae bacterium]
MCKITMKDIARKANVSKSTVSRALGDDPRVNEKTRKKIKMIAKKMNYQPHKAAKALACQNTNIIGVVFPTFPRSVADPFFLEFLQGIGEIAVNNSYSLTLYNNKNKEENKLKMLFHRHNVDGIILTEPKINDTRIDYLKNVDIPYVFLGNPMKDKKINWVETDNQLGAYQAVSYLIESGHRSIATITGSLDLVAGQYRLQGYKNALSDSGINYNKRLIVNADFTQESAYKAAKKLIKTESKFSAIFAANDLMALGVIKALKDEGISIPDDIAVMGYDGIKIGEFVEPPLTTIYQSGNKMGQIAINLLLQLIRKEKVKENHVLLPPELIIRGSA